MQLHSGDGARYYGATRINGIAFDGPAVLPRIVEGPARRPAIALRRARLNVEMSVIGLVAGAIAGGIGCWAWLAWH